MIKKIFLLVSISLITFLASTQAINAQTVDLNEYVAGSGFQQHTLSTGEVIRFEAVGGPGPTGTAPVRMHKGGNYEQFYVGSNGTYRAEDTSWAPLPGFVDAQCQDGSKAVYTLATGCNQYPDGTIISNDGVLWSVRSASIGESWSTPTHEILTISAETGSGKKSCSVTDPPGYPACNQSQSILLEEYYSPSEFTFCTGIKNESELIKLRVTAGYGLGDTFYFMKGWGLVGFEAPGFQSAIIDGGGDASGCTGAEGPPDGKKLNRPLDEGFEPGKYQCTDEVDPQFSVLRPYPANSCDPLIPQSRPPATAGGLAPDYMRYITYSCGNNLIPEYREDFDPYGVNAQYTGRVLDDGAGGQYVHTYCDQTGPFAEPTEVTCYRSVRMKLDVDLKDANFGILGNSQDPSLDHKQLVNNYLSYYFMGIPQIVDQITDETEEATRKLVEYSGPWRKLAPWELQNIQLRTAIAKEGARTKDKADNLNIHNYEIADSFWGKDKIAEYTKTGLLGEKRLPPEREGKDLPQYLREQFDWRFGKLSSVDFLRSLFGYQTKWARLFQSVPLSSLEDTAGEFVLSIFKPEDGYEYGQQDTAVVDPQGVGDIKTTQAKIVILNAQKAKGPAGSIITPPSTYSPPPSGAISCGEPIKIMPFGDSITAGYGDSPTGYRDALYTKLQQSSVSFDFVGDSQPETGLDPDHEGHGNTNPTNLALGVRTWINNNPADVVLVHAGTVNLYSQFNPSDPNNLEQAENTPHIKGMRKILETLNENGNVKKILLATIIKRYDGDDGERSEAYNKVLRKIASDYSKATIVEMENVVTPDEMMSDRVHPTMKGSDDMAEIWKNAVLANCR